MRPFKYGSVVSGENFCPRPKLERELQEYARNGQNLVIQGARRMGKTSIVRHAIGSLKGMKLIYIDLYFIRTRSDLCEQIMYGVSKASEDISFLKKVTGFVQRLRPTLAIDPKDGSFSVTVDARAAAEPDSLNAVMEALAKISADGKTCVVFDEFQDILNLGDADQILAKMRGVIQFQEHTPYFFTGSIRNQMMDIFCNPDKPFYKSALPFAVEEIDTVDFVRFLSGCFRKGERKISDLTLSKVIAFADGVTGDVQELCDALWSVTEKGEEITEARIPDALDLIFSREIKGYEAIAQNLTSAQSVLLRALAEKADEKIYSASFTARISLSPSSVKRVVEKLIALRLVYAHEKGFRFHDPFFREWLRRRR